MILSNYFLSECPIVWPNLDHVSDFILGADEPMETEPVYTPPKKPEPKPEPKKEPEPELPENAKQARSEKELGNASYKKKDFPSKYCFYIQYFFMIYFSKKL